MKIVAERFFGTPTYFCWQLAFHRHLPTSGRQNTVKKGPQPLFAQNVFVPLCIPAFSPFMAHHNISLRFRAMVVTHHEQAFALPRQDHAYNPHHMMCTFCE